MFRLPLLPAPPMLAPRFGCWQAYHLAQPPRPAPPAFHAESIVAAGGQVLVIGKGDQHFERALTHVSERFPGQVAVRIGFDEGTARRIFAGSDFILMPSRYEPCGLSQMYAQRFGALPIGRETGG